MVALNGYAQRRRGQTDFRFVVQFLGAFFLVPLVACSPSSSFKMNTVDELSELESVFREENLDTRSIGGAALTKCQA